MRKRCQLNVDDVDVDRKRDGISIQVLKEFSAESDHEQKTAMFSNDAFSLASALF